MKIKEQIREDLKQAMREHNEIAKNTLKGALSSFTNELVSLGKTPRDELEEKDILKVLKRLEKQRRDAVEKYAQGGRDDLAEIEKNELKILKKYIPEQISQEKILEIAKKKKEELKIEDKTKMGILIGAIMKETDGTADGSDVQKVVQSLF